MDEADDIGEGVVLFTCPPAQMDERNIQQKIKLRTKQTYLLGNASASWHVCQFARVSDRDGVATK